MGVGLYTLGVAAFAAIGSKFAGYEASLRHHHLVWETLANLIPFTVGSILLWL